ncbi:hypothetical protein A2634_03660 [Candidatus Amesbacteria bacterium RIFCSPHIGHO2_01_FULL_48_32]|uniref:Uncharacterized protein n=1 Tax=Candidatus Amesbacteria bacterium RIFCSPLOWO2_01_FULL_48_25 TaxID=1797259 RepID=A0A1F4ZC39_9BACT|nr:MAG: hypothetical protein A2634_03660 [Candidatus Amesbacteria bacterium RIFCSPHIGHO2_01_FULL_48_32]OGD03775.1 MAG: hypothetical protein A2989_03780 [Candidatus Amesbacteria bacterium RIFCSPLOWO2_01_FULL_48_25]HJZ05119.1 hypothetical protein [Patescibacteria group bacterium]
MSSESSFSVGIGVLKDAGNRFANHMLAPIFPQITSPNSKAEIPSTAQNNQKKLLQHGFRVCAAGFIISLTATASEHIPPLIAGLLLLAPELLYLGYEITDVLLTGVALLGVNHQTRQIPK